MLDEEELEGVLAHEMSHIRNYDVRLMTWAAVLAGSIAMLAWIFTRALWFGGGDRDRGGGAANIIVLVAVVLSLILAPIAAMLIQVAISRRASTSRTRRAAELTRYPQGLASALRVISGDTQPSRASGQPRDRAHDDRGAAGRAAAAPPSSSRRTRRPRSGSRSSRRWRAVPSTATRRLTEGRALPREPEQPSSRPEQPMAETGL